MDRARAVVCPEIIAVHAVVSGKALDLHDAARPAARSASAEGELQDRDARNRLESEPEPLCGRKGYCPARTGKTKPPADLGMGPRPPLTMLTTHANGTEPEPKPAQIDDDQ